ncbi:MAG: slipin family protein [Candidatus Pacebacteria bacterium]|nr:slipin family protein [Candidatus Paceibacterota bacterium]
MEFFTLLIILIVLAVILLREVKQYERGVVLTMGRFTSLRSPGWSIIVPIFQNMEKVDLRVKAVDVPDQKVITRDNVSASINAVIYYKVADAAKAVLEVEDFRYAVSQLAQTTMRNVVGGADLDEVLAQRDKLSERIQLIIDAETDKWGIKVDNVELKDFFLPEEMERTIAKQAEAERERRAVIIKAEGEVVAAENIAKAATMLSNAPGALHLRTLQTLNDLSSDQSNTVVFATPIEVLRAFEGVKEWLDASTNEKLNKQ